MGMSISAKLMYGMNYELLCEHLEDEVVDQLNEMIDDGELDTASPYYDSDREEWFVGYELARGVVNMETLNESVENVKFDFFEKFGTYGEVRVVKHVY